MRHGLSTVLPVALLASLAACSAGRTAEHGTVTVTVTRDQPTKTVVTPSTAPPGRSVTASATSSQPPHAEVGLRPGEGWQPGADVALVRTSADLPGKPPSWSSVIIDGVTRYGLLELDFAANHGNSGGPVINARGQAVGLVDAQTDYVNDQGAQSGERQGDRLAVAASTAQKDLERWRSDPESIRPPDCAEVIGPDGERMPADQYPQDIAQQAFQTLRIYFGSVNNGDYPTALAQLAHPVSVGEFARRVKSANDTDFEVGDVSLDAVGNPVVSLTFQSHQDAGDGPADRPEETCTRWSLDYQFSKVNGLWLIERARRNTTTSRQTNRAADRSRRPWDDYPRWCRRWDSNPHALASRAF